MWNDLLAAIALVLVFEGIIPFLNPGGLRKTLQQLLNMPDKTIRLIGLVSMIAGVLLLYFVRLN